MARPSRALRPSATTTRYVGCLVAPTRVSRIRTAMATPCSWICGTLGTPALLDRDDCLGVREVALERVRHDERIERGQVRLSVLLVLAEFRRVFLGHHALEETADRRDVHERRRRAFAGSA